MGIPDLMIHNPATRGGLGVSNSEVLKKPCLNNFLGSLGWVGANEARRTLMNEDTKEKDLENGGPEEVRTDSAGMRDL